MTTHDIETLIGKLRRGVPYHNPLNTPLDHPNVSAADRLMEQAADALDEAVKALNEIASFQPKSFDFAAPTDVATFCQNRARDALSAIRSKEGA